MGKPAFRPYVNFIAALCAICATPLASPAAFSSPADLFGELQQYEVREHDSLVEIARRFDVGFNSIVDANPGVDPFVPSIGTLLTIPTAWILPAVSERPVIVINIPEFRLYYFPRESSVLTFPLGIGDEGKDTPVGDYSIIEKISGPAWHVPRSIRAKEPYPKIVPPGPDNPMGSHALRLSLTSILIHGTNRPWGIGRRSSHGCLRLYPEDIVRLYRLVPKGTRVMIVNNPVKVCARGKKILVEAHRHNGEGFSVGQAMHLLADMNLLGRTDFAKLIRAMEEKKGVPVDVTLNPDPRQAPQQGTAKSRGAAPTKR